jgi:predicted dehydrogenase
MHGFHVALIGVGGRWDAHMLAIAEGFGKVTFELAAVVGLPDQIAERKPVAIQMPLDAGGFSGKDSARFTRNLGSRKGDLPVITVRV